MKIVQYPHPALRTKARPVTALDGDIVKAANEMLELMYKHEGLGLAAPQVAIPYRVLVMNFAGDAERLDQEYVAINPVIIEQKGTIDDREGCLSFPEMFGKVRRSKSVKVQAYNLKGELYEMSASELPARVWQHEIDHLNGVLFLDKLGFVSRMNTKKDVERFIAEFNEAKAKGELPPDMEPKY